MTGGKLLVGAPCGAGGELEHYQATAILIFASHLARCQVDHTLSHQVRVGYLFPAQVVWWYHGHAIRDDLRKQVRSSEARRIRAEHTYRLETPNGPAKPPWLEAQNSNPVEKILEKVAELDRVCSL